jgi:hypothetical protein
MANRLIPSGQNEGSVELGTFSFTNVSSVALPDNIFSTQYDNYLITISANQITTATNVYFRLRGASGTLNDSYYYGSQGWSSAGAAINRAAANGGGVYMTGATTMKADNVDNAFRIWIYNPITTGRKNFFYQSAYWNSSDVQNSLIGGGFNSNASTATSLNFVLDSGTTTGTWSVYGMRK